MQRSNMLIMQHVELIMTQIQMPQIGQMLQQSVFHAFQLIVAHVERVKPFQWLQVFDLNKNMD